MPDARLVINFGDDTEYAGARVVLRRRVTLEEFFGMQAAFTDGVATAEGIAGAIRFGDYVLASWNLHAPRIDPDSGAAVVDADGAEILEPVPCDGAHLIQQPVDFCMALLNQWYEAVGATIGQVPSPLGGGSPSGTPPAAPPTPAAPGGPDPLPS